MFSSFSSVIEHLINHPAQKSALLSTLEQYGDAASTAAANSDKSVRPRTYTCSDSGASQLADDERDISEGFV
jgi:hypothetical protein